MVGHARAHGLSRAAALCRAHRLACAAAGESRRRQISARRWSICGSGAKPISCTTRSKDGALINIVVIINDEWNAPGWSAPASRDELLPRLSVERVAPAVLGLINQPQAWLKWALFDRRPLLNWSQGAVALIGDAAHPMLPYLAQGAAMAIEDAAVAAQCLAQMPDDATEALRAYCAVRRARAWKVQRLATRNGQRYHLAGISAVARNTAMRIMGGTRLLHHYDWLYDWRPPATLSIT